MISPQGTTSHKAKISKTQKEAGTKWKKKVVTRAKAKPIPMQMRVPAFTH